MSRHIFKRLLAASCVALVGACSPASETGGITSGPTTIVSDAVSIGGAFTLTDHDGQIVTDQSFLGTPMLIYFGFAYCPDVCPTALQRMGAAMKIAKLSSNDVQSILITVDPERDTPEQLALYVTANGFPEGLRGLTGSPEQIDAVKKIYLATGNKVEDPDNPGSFTYDHTDFIYLMGADGKFIDIFTSSDTPQEMADQLRTYKKTGR